MTDNELILEWEPSIRKMSSGIAFRNNYHLDECVAEGLFQLVLLVKNKRELLNHAESLERYIKVVVARAICKYFRNRKPEVKEKYDSTKLLDLFSEIVPDSISLFRAVNGYISLDELALLKANLKRLLKTIKE